MAGGTEAVHTTEHYAVHVGNDEYEVLNVNTGVIEAREKMLPQAILHAENSNSFIVNRLWRWVAAQGQQNGEALDKDVSMAEFEAENSLN